MKYIKIKDKKDKKEILEILKATFNKEETKKLPYGKTVAEHLEKQIKEFKNTGNLSELLYLRLIYNGQK
jgi:hypothetical protein